jgi:hypothetical protein
VRDLNSAGDRNEAAAWLAAGLCLPRVLACTEEDLVPVGPWLLAAMGERLDLPPAGVVADVGALLHGRPPASQAYHASLEPRLRLAEPRLETAIRRYEDGVLARLYADARLGACSDAMARLSPELRALAVGILVASLLGRVGFDRGVALAPGLVRAAMRRPARAILERGSVALRDAPATRDALAAGYEALVRGSQRTAQLLSDADVFTLENLTALRSLTQRVAIAQIVEAQEAIARGFPRRVRSTRPRGGSTATRLEDESEYPVGGFSAIATSGALENLVTSELIYMDRAAAVGVRPPVDLFDLRYAEGELLYYTRDETVFTRPRRVVTFLLGDELTAMRVKDAQLPWQRIVLVLGLLTATIKRLSEELANEDLALRVVFVRQAAEQPSVLRPERELCELALREYRDRGVLTIDEGTVAAEAQTLAAAARRALVEVVFLAPADREAAMTRWEAAARAVRLPLRMPCVVAGANLARGADLDAYSETAVELVSALL